MVGLCGEKLGQFFQLLVVQLQEDATGLEPRREDRALARQVEDLSLPQDGNGIRSHLEPPLCASGPGCVRGRSFPEIEVRPFPSADHSHVATSRAPPLDGGRDVRPKEGNGPRTGFAIWAPTTWQYAHPRFAGFGGRGRLDDAAEMIGHSPGGSRSIVRHVEEMVEVAHEHRTTVPNPGLLMADSGRGPEPVRIVHPQSRSGEWDEAGTARCFTIGHRLDQGVRTIAARRIVGVTVGTCPPVAKAADHQPSDQQIWSLRSDSNRRPAHYECAALPTELPRRLPTVEAQVHNRDEPCERPGRRRRVSVGQRGREPGDVVNAAVRPAGPG
jgi:hypothetical protein